ncbi:hypothetical protein ACFU98_45785 [Streptomyces sp. NPDC057575]|uniref:hypothetical protein n=1 Tax=unclassified Streptomyces TaxID=2593676 RepID=UPI0036924679
MCDQALRVTLRPGLGEQAGFCLGQDAFEFRAHALDVLRCEAEIEGLAQVAGPQGPRHLGEDGELTTDLAGLAPDYRIERFGTKLGDLRVTVADRFEDEEFDGEFAGRGTALTLPKSSPSTPP